MKITENTPFLSDLFAETGKKKTAGKPGGGNTELEESVSEFNALMGDSKEGGAEENGGYSREGLPMHPEEGKDGTAAGRSGRARDFSEASGRLKGKWADEFQGENRPVPSDGNGGETIDPHRDSSSRTDPSRVGDLDDSKGFLAGAEAGEKPAAGEKPVAGEKSAAGEKTTANEKPAAENGETSENVYTTDGGKTLSDGLKRTEHSSKHETSDSGYEEPKGDDFAMTDRRGAAVQTEAGKAGMPRDVQDVHVLQSPEGEQAPADLPSMTRALGEETAAKGMERPGSRIGSNRDRHGGEEASVLTPQGEREQPAREGMTRGASETPGKFASTPHDGQTSPDTDRNLSGDRSADSPKTRGEPNDATPDSEYLAAFSSMGDSILSGLKPSDTVRQAPAEAFRASESTLNEISTEIAQRILVTDPSMGGKNEVRIWIKDSILPGTEVRISRDKDSVQIDLVTTNEKSLDFLSGRRNDLREHLNQRLGEEAKVSVSFSSGEGREENQGRSRQRINLYDEWEEDNRTR